MTTKIRKAVILTGAAGGIGTTIYDVLKENYEVLGFDLITNERIEFLDLNEFAKSEKAQNHFYETITNKCLRNNLTIYGIINNAAIQKLGSLEQLNLNDWEQTISVNLTAPMFLSKIFKKELSLSFGVIINISSVHALSSKYNFSFYATSKAALSGLTRSLALEMAPHVRVNAILPAAIETDMLKKGFFNREEQLNLLKDYHPLKRIGQPSDIAALVKYLLSDHSKFITGSNIPVDGGILSRLHDPD